MDISKRRRTILALLLGSIFGLAARADWLVTKDGSRLELKGPYKVDGKRVVFTLVDGKLSSLRADQVDLAASARETEKAAKASSGEEKQAQAAVAEAPEKPRRSFTDKDFSHPAEAKEGDAAPSEAVVDTPPAAASAVDVIVWRQAVDPGRNRVDVSGTLRNGGQNLAAAIQLEVRLVDHEGKALATQLASVTTPRLAPGETTDFRTTFPQIVNFESVKFDVKATEFKVQPSPQDKAKEPPPDASDGGGR